MDEKPQNYWQPGNQQPQPTQSPPVNQNQTVNADLQIEERGEPTGFEISWRASEYIHHDKSALWYIVLGIVTLVGVGLAIWLQQWIFAALVLVMGVAFGVYAGRQPREASYSITDEGIYINNQLLSYSDFRSFGVIDDGAFFALQLRPVKRFMPALIIYFAEADGEAIVDALSERLPMEEVHVDAVDRLMRWLRF